MLRRWEYRHGLGEVLLQSEVEVADLELLGEFEGGVGVLVAYVFGGARDPFIDGCLIWVVTPRSGRILSVYGIGGVQYEKGLRAAP
jgi:hypothetical protein